MSKTVAYKSIEHNESRETSRKRGGENEGDGGGEGMIMHSLTTVSFPTTLAYIGALALADSSLENVDLLHTKLQELGHEAFCHCYKLKSMTIPDSLQTFDYAVFTHCSKLVPSNIDVRFPR